MLPYSVHDGCHIGVFAEKRQNGRVLAVWGLVIVCGEQSKKWNDGDVKCNLIVEKYKK